MRSPAIRKVALPAWLLALALTSALRPAHAEDGTISLPPGERPVPVRLGLWLLDVSSLNEITSTFSIETDVISSWRDVRLAFEEDPAAPGPRVYQGARAQELLAGMWSPLGQAVNGVGSLSVGRQILSIHPEGTCVLEARLVATLRAPLEFRRFPFDSQVLPIEVESFAWDASAVRLEPRDEYTGFDEGFDLAEWDVRGFGARTSVEPRGREGRLFSRLTFELEVQRRAGYFLWRILVPLVIIVMISCVVFWMKGERLGRRAGVSSTGMLTVIAYQFVVAGSLPRVPYLTLMDHFVLASLVTIAGTMVVNVFVERRAEAPERAAAVDRLARWLFPAAYLVAILAIAARARIL